MRLDVVCILHKSGYMTCNVYFCVLQVLYKCPAPGGGSVRGRQQRTRNLSPVRVDGEDYQPVLLYLS